MNLYSLVWCGQQHLLFLRTNVAWMVIIIFFFGRGRSGVLHSDLERGLSLFLSAPSKLELASARNNMVHMIPARGKAKCEPRASLLM